MIDVIMNHDIICTKLDSTKMQKLLEKEYVRNTQVGSLHYGWGVVIFYSWLKHMLFFKSTAVMKVLSSDEDIMRKATKLYRLAQNATVVRPILDPVVLGGNIIVSKDMTLSVRDMSIALGLDKSPLATYLLKICGNKFGVNKICTSDLKEVISQIDFAIPSLSLLFKVMGFNYLNNQPYLSEGILLSSCQKCSGLVCAFYGSSFTKYKRMEPLTLATLAASNMLSQPMSRQDTIQLHVETNDICK